MGEKTDIFDDLFLTKEEQLYYDLQKLEKQFILSQEDMLNILRTKAVNTIISANSAKEEYFDYIRWIKQPGGGEN